MSGYIGPAPVPQATQTRETFTATASQTSFATAGYTVGYLDVYLNGVHLVDGDDYTASNGSDVVLSSGATAGDILEVVAYKPFEVVDQNFTGDFSVDTDTLYVDSTNNRVGIGTSSPNKPLHVSGDSSAGNVSLEIENRDGSNASSRAVLLLTTGLNSAYMEAENGSGGAGFLAFGNEGSEAMRIESDGSFRVSNTSNPVYSQTTGAGQFYWDAPQSSLAMSHDNSSGFSPLYVNKFNFTAGTSNNRFVAWYVNGSSLASITTDGASVSYNTSSDYRLKENIKPVSDAPERVLALKPVNFTWKTTGTRVDGFLAHEAQEVVPEAVSGEKDALDSEGNPEYQGIDQGKLVPLLTAALQDALQKIEQLETRIAALENTQ